MSGAGFLFHDQLKGKQHQLGRNEMEKLRRPDTKARIICVQFADFQTIFGLHLMSSTVCRVWLHCGNRFIEHFHTL